MTQLDNPYRTLVAAGAKIDHHESDLYVRATEEALAIVRASHRSFTMFVSQIDGQSWIEIPFAYEPFWNVTP